MQHKEFSALSAEIIELQQRTQAHANYSELANSHEVVQLVCILAGLANDDELAERLVFDLNLIESDGLHTDDKHYLSKVLHYCKLLVAHNYPRALSVARDAIDGFADEEYTEEFLTLDTIFSDVTRKTS